jgi:hypothetical protein
MVLLEVSCLLGILFTVIPAQAEELYNSRRLVIQ